MQVIFNGAMQHAYGNTISGESFFLSFYFTALFLIAGFKTMFKSWVNDGYTLSKFVLKNSWAKWIDDNDNNTFLIQEFKL